MNGNGKGADGMTSEEIVNAMRNKSRVMYNGAEYKCITEYILTIDKIGRQRRSVTLLDKNGSTTVRVLASKIEVLEDERWDTRKI